MESPIETYRLSSSPAGAGFSFEHTIDKKQSLCYYESMSTKTNTLTLEKTELGPVFQTSEDLKSALLVVSVIINLAIFTAFLVVQVDPNLSLVLVSSAS